MLPRLSNRIFGRIFLHTCLFTTLLVSTANKARAQSYIYEINTIPLTSETAGFVGTSILQDSDGFMWFGSWQGLFRYDGANFKQYTFNPSEEIISGKGSSGLSNDQTEYLFEDEEGIIWFTNYYSVVRFDRKTETFQHFMDHPITQELYPAVECSDGYVWLGLRSGLSRFDKKSGTFRHYPNYRSGDPSSGSIRVSKIFEDSQGILWLTVMPSCDLMIFNREQETFHPIENVPAPIQNFYEDRSGRLWITTSNGLYHYQRESGSFQRYLYRADDPDRLYSQHLGNILQDSSGNFWLNSTEGIYHYSEDLEKLGYWKFPEENLPIWNDSITGVPEGRLYMDRSGIIWFVHGNRIGNLTRRYNNFTLYKPLKTTSFDRGVTDPDHRIFVSTPGASGTGFYMLNRRKHEFTRLTVDPENPIGKFGFTLKDKKGTLWIATRGNGLYRGTRDKEGILKFEQVFSNPKDSSNLPNLDVYHLFEDSEGRIWMEARGHWPCFYDPDSDQIVHLVNNPHSTDSLPGIYSSGLARGRVQGETNNGSLLASHQIYGMFAIIPPLIKVSEHAVMATDIIRFRPENGSKVISGWDSYVSPGDSTGTIWARGDRGGFLKITPANPERMDDFTFRSRLYSTKDGLPSSKIAVFIEDDQGHFWLGRSRGLSQFDPETETFKNYNAYDGLPDLNFDLVYKAEDGELIFHTDNGYFISFYPDSIRLNSRIPSIVLTDFKINQQSISPWNHSVLDTTITFTKQIELSYNQNDITLSYAALNYLQTSRNQYRYKLEGYNSDWIYAENRTSVDYTNLRPGKYVFTVIGSNNDGIWNEDGASLQIHIAHPPWKTAWAYLGYGIILIGIILWFRRYFLNRARMRTAVEVAKVEKEKIWELDQMKSRFFANISHEFRTPLTLILGPLEDSLKKETLRFNWSRDLVTMMHRNAIRLQRLINQLLDLSKLETTRLRLQVSEGNLEETLEIIILSFLSHAERKHVKYTYRLPGKKFKVYYDTDKVEKILTNLLSNAFKYTADGGNVRIKLEYVLSMESGSPQYAAIEVSDTGRGIPKEQLDRIFDRFYQINDKDMMENEGTGIGLALTRELAVLCRGEIHVESELGKGSTFTVRLPVSRDSFSEEEIATTTPSQDAGTVSPETEVVLKEPAQQRVLQSKPPERPKDAPLVLIVEDNDDLRRYISGNLETRYRILTAENGKIGLELALERIPDLIISDVMMPVMDGIEMCRYLKTDERTDHIPVVMLTAKADRGSKLEGLTTGADEYIIKPFDADELQVRVRNMIEQQKRLRERFYKEFVFGEIGIEVKGLDERFLKQTMDLIQSHISDQEFNVQSLGQIMEISQMQLYRKLKGSTNMSPGELIRNMRLKNARVLLKKQYDNISQVAYQVGFSDHSYFTKCFRKLYGITPKAYAEGTIDKL